MRFSIRAEKRRPCLLLRRLLFARRALFSEIFLAIRPRGEKGDTIKRFARSLRSERTVITRLRLYYEQ